MRDTEKAFLWIVGILEKFNVVYKISGGFAARIHGVDRELADIDIDVRESDILKLADDVAPYITFGPARYVDEHWDLELMTLRYEGQEIDIAGIGAKIFNNATKCWEMRSDVPYSIEMRKVFGRSVPVECINSLIAYKSKLARKVDLEDVKQLKQITAISR